MLLCDCMSAHAFARSIVMLENRTKILFNLKKCSISHIIRFLNL